MLGKNPLDKGKNGEELYFSKEKDESDDTKLTLGLTFAFEETSKWNSMEADAAVQLKLMSEMDRKELITLLGDKSLNLNHHEEESAGKFQNMNDASAICVLDPKKEFEEGGESRRFIEPKLFQVKQLLSPSPSNVNMEQKIKNLVSPDSITGEESFKTYDNNTNNINDMNDNSNNYPNAFEKASYQLQNESSGEEEVNGKRKRKRLTRHQSQVLSCMFPDDASLSQIDKGQLAKQLNLDSRQLSVWFQNRKARSKQKHAEQECEKLKRLCTELLKENVYLKESLKGKYAVCSKCKISI